MESKTRLNKTFGKTNLLHDRMETVIFDIGRHLNILPPTYVEGSQEEEQI